MKPAKGFTIIEVVVTIGIFSFIIVTMLMFTARSYSSFFSLNDKTSVVTKARQAVDVLGGEMREAQSSDIGAYALVSATATELIFYANVDASSDIERVRYTISGSDFLRGTIKPVGTPASYPPGNEQVKTIINALVPGSTTFTYYPGTFTGSEAPLSAPVNPASVRYIVLAISLDETPGEKPEPIDIVTGSTLRNLKDNL
jgi:type II secretory pathway pseudopilin PulG